MTTPDNVPTDTKIAAWVREQCERRRLSWNQASRKAGLDHSAISRIIRGTRPSPETCKKLAAFFGATPDYVLYLAGHRNSPGEEKLEIDPVFLPLLNRLKSIKSNAFRHFVARQVIAFVDMLEATGELFTEGGRK